MDLDIQRLQEALSLLGELLAEEKKEFFHLVVCGGSGLLARKVISRATQDVDVLAQRDWDLEVHRAHPLPHLLADAASKVAQELDLPANWLNSSASFHFPDYDLLPHSFWTDLETHEYGGWLRVSFVGRDGQILLKIYAALNRSESRDFEDLKALAPDLLETEKALKWTINAFPGLTHRSQLPDLLSYLGHDTLTKKFQG